MAETDWSAYVNQMYDSQLKAQTESINQDKAAAMGQLDDQKIQAQRQTDANLTRTAVESQKAQKNYAEVKNAYGLTSGASAQARLASDNQLQADLTALRTAQQEGDAMRERERVRLAEYYASAIREAQANNDLERAKMLYELAREAEANGGGGGYGGGGGRSYGGGSGGGDSGSGTKTWVDAFKAADSAGDKKTSNAILTEQANKGNVSPQDAVKLATTGKW